MASRSSTFAFLILAAALPTYPQTTTGSIHGIVLDSSRRPIAGAELSAENQETGLRRRTESDPSGAYRFELLPPGVYRLSASARDLQTVVMDGLRLTVDSHLRQDLSLPVAARRDSIDVSAPPAQVETESPATGAVLDRERIASLPLNRRDFLQLSLLGPGVLPPVQDSELSSRGSFAMHAGGAREEFNNFTLDGADNNDLYNNRYVLQPSVESIREFRILSGSYSAEYGRSAGAQVNVITRSGGNDWHGALYEYFRNRPLDARNFFDPGEQARLVRNQFGGSVGGPVRRDRTFLFANYEALRERRALSRLAAVPSVAERSGDFTSSAVVPVDPFTRQPFAGNRIPASRISPVARNILELFPLPNRPAGLVPNHLSQPVLADRTDNLVTRLDHRLSPRHEIMLRYGYGFQDLFEPFAEESTDVAGFGNFVRNNGHNVSVQHQAMHGPTAVQATRFTYGRAFRRALQQNHAIDAGSLWGVGWLGVRPRDFGFPSIKAAGFSVVGDLDQAPLERYTATWQIHHAVSLLRGSHSLKFGGELRRAGADAILDFFSRGSLTFSGALSGAGISDLLLGLPSFGIQSTFDNRQSLRSTAYNLFLQDDWRIRPSLSLSLGLRYEYNTPPTDPEDRMYILQPASGRLVQVGREGIPRSGLRADRNNFGPRIGFAWNATPEWVVRGGSGLFYDSGMFVVNSSLYFNPPLFNVRIFFPTQTSLLTLNDPFPSRGGITPPPSPNTLSPDITSSYLQHWNLSTERRLSASTTGTIAYVGSKGTHLIRSRDLNQPRPGPGLVALRRPNPALGNIFFIESGGNSSFHSLQGHVNRRFAGSLSLLASYTWSKSIDDASAFLGTRTDKNFPQDSGNYRAERALSSYDIRHRLSAAVVLASPWRHWLVRSSELRSIFVAQTGQPFTPILRFDNSNTGNTGSIFGSDRPDLLGDPRLSERRPERWFRTEAFAVPARFTFGSAGRNVVSGPGVVNFDLAFSRRLRLSESVGLAVEAQAFNLLNTPHFDSPERFADEPSTFGRIFSAKPPRQLQLVLRLSF